MEAKELRLNNLVEMGQEGIGSVSGYNLYQLTVKENGVPVADYYHNWKPIPLTEDWLLRFEFDYSHWATKWILHDMPIPTKINYVHQLQNLYFALTGQELELKQTTEA